MRATSLEAYKDIVNSGVLGKRQVEAYEVLYDHGPLTAGELVDESGVSGLWKRLSELRDMGIIEEVGKRKCRITGAVCIEWDVNGKRLNGKAQGAPKQGGGSPGKQHDVKGIVGAIQEAGVFGFDLETTGFYALQDRIVGMSIAVAKNRHWWFPFYGPHSQGDKGYSF